tara:strand:+ start:1166 stop:1849 length:684 start_codon:yes stop_codon:yes gene_type:complete
MSQHDFNIANQLFPATRADLNNAFVALASNSSGDAEPGTTYANQWWYETDINTLKLRNEANNAWISIAVLDQSANNVLSITTQGLTIGATALTATGAEINLLDALTRGSIIYGNASGATARLTKGAASTVLTSDGTDISWTAPAGIPTTFGAVNTYAWCGRASNSTLLEGASVAGSDLKYAGSESTNAFNDNTAMQITGTSPSGTWKVMGNASNTGRFPATLVLRIS